VSMGAAGGPTTTPMPTVITILFAIIIESTNVPRQSTDA
jgi:hypothetical protein